MIKSLWRVQHFGLCKKPVRLAQLQKYGTYSGPRVTELVISCCRQFGLDHSKLNYIVGSCRSLKILKLQSLSNEGLGVIPPGELDEERICLSQMTSLYLGEHPLETQTRLLYKLVESVLMSSAETLQELSILNREVFAHYDAKQWPVLKNLRILRLGGQKHAHASMNLVGYSHL